MGLIDKPLIGQGLSSPDPLVREAYLMVYDYINYVTAKPGTPLGPAPSQASAALRHAGDELLQRFPIFFRHWPRVFRDATEDTACSTCSALLSDEAQGPGLEHRHLCVCTCWSNGTALPAEWHG